MSATLFIATLSLVHGPILQNVNSKVNVKGFAVLCSWKQYGRGNPSSTSFSLTSSGKLLFLSRSWFPYLLNEDKNNTHLIELCQGLHEVI